MPFNPGNKRAQRARNVPTVGGPMKFGLYPTVGVSLPFLLKLTRCCGPKNAACSGKREAVVACGASVQVCKACNVPLTCSPEVPKGSCVSQEDIRKQVYPVVEGSCEPAGFAPRYCRDCCDKAGKGPNKDADHPDAAEFDEGITDREDLLAAKQAKSDEMTAELVKVKSQELQVEFNRIWKENGNYCDDDDQRREWQEELINIIKRFVGEQAEFVSGQAIDLYKCESDLYQFQINWWKFNFCVVEDKFKDAKKKAEQKLEDAKNSPVNSVPQAQQRDDLVEELEQDIKAIVAKFWKDRQEHEAQIAKNEQTLFFRTQGKDTTIALQEKLVDCSSEFDLPLFKELELDARDGFIADTVSKLQSVKGELLFSQLDGHSVNPPACGHAVKKVPLNPAA